MKFYCIEKNKEIDIDETQIDDNEFGNKIYECVCPNHACSVIIWGKEIGGK